MKILSAEQIKTLDAFTIKNEPIASIDLMERAAAACVKRIIKLVKPGEKIKVICGKGNNGGDGLAITRLLSVQGFSCVALLIEYTENFSEDAKENYKRLKEKYPERIFKIKSIDELKEKTEKADVIVEALLGTGVNKPVEGLLGEVIQHLNKNFSKIISIDMPAGLYADKMAADNKNTINASLTLTFQSPKLAFMLPGNKTHVPEFEILDIGLSEEGLKELSTKYYYVTTVDIIPFLKKRNKFSHKGEYGHALLLAGSKGKSGAAIISAKACLRSGAGLLTLHSNKSTLDALLHHLPEAMSSEDEHSDLISQIEKPENYDAIGFGPGVGTEEDTQLVLKKLLHYYSGRLIIDADGLNILAENKTWLTFLPPDTILTPHPKEFERLTQKHTDDLDRLQELKQFSIKYNCIVVLKGAHRWDPLESTCRHASLSIL